MASTWRFQCSFDSYELATRIYQKFGTKFWTVKDVRDAELDAGLKTNITGLVQNMRNARVIETVARTKRANSTNSRFPTQWRISPYFEQHLVDYTVKKSSKYDQYDRPVRV